MYFVMYKFARNEVIWKALKIIKTRFHVPIKSVLKVKSDVKQNRIQVNKK